MCANTLGDENLKSATQERRLWEARRLRSSGRLLEHQLQAALGGRADARHAGRQELLLAWASLGGGRGHVTRKCIDSDNDDNRFDGFCCAAKVAVMQRWDTRPSAAPRPPFTAADRFGDTLRAATRAPLRSQASSPPLPRQNGASRGKLRHAVASFAAPTPPKPLKSAARDSQPRPQARGLTRLPAGATDGRPGARRTGPEGLRPGSQGRGSGPGGSAGSRPVRGGGHGDLEGTGGPRDRCTRGYIPHA